VACLRASDWAIMKPRRLLEAYGDDLGASSEAVSTLKRAQEGELISKQASAGEVKEQRTFGLIIDLWHVIGRGK
jgi:hypothetical protein